MIRTSSHRLWLLWLLFICMGSTLAFTLIGGYLNQVDDRAVDIYYPVIAPLAILIVGLLIGSGQWITLRMTRKGSFSWVPATAVGLLLGILFGIGVSRMLPGRSDTLQWTDTLIIFGVAGIFTGMLQWISLHNEFVGFYKWILVSGLGWGIGLFVVRDLILFMDMNFGIFYAAISGLVSGAIIGALSGGLVEHTLLYSLPEHDQSSK